MTQLDKLIRDARIAMKIRKHDPLPATRWHIASTEESGALIQCSRCNSTANVICKPKPNETHIAGSAVALNCNVATMMRHKAVSVFVLQQKDDKSQIQCACWKPKEKETYGKWEAWGEPWWVPTNELDPH